MKSFFFGKKRSKIRVRIIHGHALYTGKYGKQNGNFALVIIKWTNFVIQREFHFTLYVLEYAAVIHSEYCR